MGTIHDSLNVVRCEGWRGACCSRSLVIVLALLLSSLTDTFVFRRWGMLYLWARFSLDFACSVDPAIAPAAQVDMQKKMQEMYAPKKA